MSYQEEVEKIAEFWAKYLRSDELPIHEAGLDPEQAILIDRIAGGLATMVVKKIRPEQVEAFKAGIIQHLSSIEGEWESELFVDYDACKALWDIGEKVGIANDLKHVLPWKTNTVIRSGLALVSEGYAAPYVSLGGAR